MSVLKQSYHNFIREAVLLDGEINQKIQLKREDKELVMRLLKN